ncbi:unnamed protein product [Lactuca saligna]|uniref:Uncharacterized protein n=1 Tax=Lactuca saligna TaxID=75948 RepID=A0AA35ZX72_LACSI|nr:unnamed protein product [Lactuca saligna]
MKKKLTSRSVRHPISLFSHRIWKDKVLGEDPFGKKRIRSSVEICSNTGFRSGNEEGEAYEYYPNRSLFRPLITAPSQLSNRKLINVNDCIGIILINTRNAEHIEAFINTEDESQDL